MVVLVATGAEAVDHATHTVDSPLNSPSSVSQASTAPSLRVDERVDVMGITLSVYVMADDVDVVEEVVAASGTLISKTIHILSMFYNFRLVLSVVVFVDSLI